jgi:integrase
MRQLTASDVDRWLAEKAKTLSTSTLQVLHQCLNRAVNRAMARDQVKRNVVGLCEIPHGQAGRPSKSLTLVEAQALLAAAEECQDDYTIVSLVSGARTEEMRALNWRHVDLDGDPATDPPAPPSIEVWRSVREGGDTKTRKSRRTLAAPQLAVRSLRRQRARQNQQRERAGPRWVETGRVFTTALGTELDAANVRRSFRRTVKAAGLDPNVWTPRELRHSFVSLMSDHGVRLEDIAPLVGHSGTTVTEKVYRQQLRPILLKGAEAMDRIFPAGPS